MSTEEREELASLYALGLLEGAELTAFERELAADPTLGALVTELENAASRIALSAPPTPVPPAVRSRIFQEIETLRKSEEPAPIVAPSFGWIPWALAAGLAIFAGFTWTEKSRISTAYSQIAAQNDALITRLTGLEGERLRHRDDAGFGDVILSHAPAGVERMRRRNIDDRALLGRPQ